MRKGRYCYNEVVPFVAMVVLQCGQVGLTTIFKAATSKGMSYKVFIIYSYIIAALLLLPFAFIFNRKNLPPFNISFVSRICLLVLLGFPAQMLGYKGIEYSSPTLAHALSNLIPTFTFALAVIFRMERLELRNLSSQAKIIGTIVSIAGALVVLLYEGTTIVKPRSAHSILSIQNLNSSHSNWVIGGLFLTVDYMLYSMWYIVQAQTIKQYPAELVVVALYNLFVSIIAAPVIYIMEPNLSAWKISSDIMLITILYGGLYGSAITNVVLTWGLGLKGPVYVALFMPISIAIAAIMGVIFLGDALYLGSIVGAMIITVGFYVVMWGKTKEDLVEESRGTRVESTSPETSALLY